MVPILPPECQSSRQMPSVAEEFRRGVIIVKMAMLRMVYIFLRGMGILPM